MAHCQQFARGNDPPGSLLQRRFSLTGDRDVTGRTGVVMAPLDPGIRGSSDPAERPRSGSRISTRSRRSDALRCDGGVARTRQMAFKGCRSWVPWFGSVAYRQDPGYAPAAHSGMTLLWRTARAVRNWFLHQVNRRMQASGVSGHRDRLEISGRRERPESKAEFRAMARAYRPVRERLAPARPGENPTRQSARAAGQKKSPRHLAGDGALLGQGADEAPGGSGRGSGEPFLFSPVARAGFPLRDRHGLMSQGRGESREGSPGHDHYLDKQ